MPAAISLQRAATAIAVRPKRHWCVFRPCGGYLGWAEPACARHRGLLPAAARKALRAAWDGGRGARSAEFTDALASALGCLIAESEAGK